MENLKRKTFYADVIDEKAIEVIRTKYGLSTESDAVRFCLRLVADSDIQLKKKTKKS